MDQAHHAALDGVIRDQHPRLVALLTVRTGSAAVAEELAQDALVELVSRWPNIDRPAAWLTRVALNRSASWWRRRYAESRAVRRHGPSPAVEQAPATADALALHEELSRLSEQHQRVLLLRWFAGLDVAETAEVLGVAEGTVRSRTHRALRQLRHTSQLRENPDAI